MARKHSKRKDGKPTRREKSARNREEYRRASRQVDASILTEEPASYIPVTDELIMEAFRLMGLGSTFRSACRQLRIHRGDAQFRIASDDQLSGHYARARIALAEAWADDIVELADKELKYDADGAHVELAHRKLMGDRRQWLMGKFHVARFGDKVTAVLEGGDKPLKTVTREMTVEEAQAAFEEERKRGG